MPNTQIVETNHEYRNLPISTLVESPTNPRKRFDERTLGELAASFKTQGVLEPLLVRALEETKYEVVIGARRLKAARLAELASVPVPSSVSPTPRPSRPRWSRTCNAKTSPPRRISRFQVAL